MKFKVYVFKERLKNILPNVFLRIIRYFLGKVRSLKVRIKGIGYYSRQAKRNEIIQRNLRNKTRIKVAFLVTHAAVWKYDDLYRLLKKNDRFEARIFICPVTNYGEENMLRESRMAHETFLKKGYEVVNCFNEDNGEFLDINTNFGPDILFFSNPHQITTNDYYIYNFNNSLSCYVQYSFHVSALNQMQYNQPFHNLLWRFFCETDMHKKMSRRFSDNKAKNVVVTGYPGVDSFFYGERTEGKAWKKQEKNKKRIIWAPHHTIEAFDVLSYSTFLNYSELMIKMAEKYKDKVQIAFKPHPILRSKLVLQDDWGEERVLTYYKYWENTANCQLEEGEYQDLFNESDAMIFDSGSFVAEYLFTGKPSMFLFSSDKVHKQFNEFGKITLGLHSQGWSENDIERFILDVIEGKDEKSNERREFYDSYVSSINHKSASLNIYESLLTSLGVPYDKSGPLKK